MKKVFLNAGHHPGIDPGSVNVQYNLEEAVVAAAICDKIAVLLADAGIEVESLQSDNLCGESPDYPCVCDTANNSDADIFVSVHCNAAESRQANGTEVLVFSQYSESQKLAWLVQDQITSALNTYNRGVKARPDLAVLRNTIMPAILVETAFISNEADVRLLMFDQDTFAEAIADGIIEFLG